MGKNNVLEQLIEIYKPDGRDWMGFTPSKKSPYTFHHILEKRNGGTKTVDNGAILTKNAHILLNDFDLKVHDHYELINHEFKLLNDTKLPPTEEYYQNMQKLVFEAQIALNAVYGLELAYLIGDETHQKEYILTRE